MSTLPAAVSLWLPLAETIERNETIQNATCFQNVYSLVLTARGGCRKCATGQKKLIVRGRALNAFQELGAAVIVAIRGILGSKKFVAAIAAAISAGAVRVGLPAISTESIALVLSPILAAILGQGVADAGKYFNKADGRD